MSGAIAMRVNEEHLKETLEKLVELHPGLDPGGPRATPERGPGAVPPPSTMRVFTACGERAWPVQPLGCQGAARAARPSRRLSRQAPCACEQMRPCSMLSPASCCVAGRAAVRITDTASISGHPRAPVRRTPPMTLAALRARAVHEAGPPWLRAGHELAGVEDAMRHGGSCARCGAWSRLLLVAPCRHLLCTDCAGLDRRGARAPCRAVGLQ